MSTAPDHVSAILVPFVLTFVLIVPLMCSSHVNTTGQEMRGYVQSMFSSVCIGAAVSTLIGTFSHLRENGLGAALWGVILGLIIGNVLDYCGGETGAHLLKMFTPACKKGEFYIKIGLVLLAEQLGKITGLGVHGFVLAWTKPLLMVYAAYYICGWKIQSPTLCVIIAAGLSICGASACSAAAAAVQAPPEELTAAISVVTIGTLIFQLATPFSALAMGLTEEVAGAWIGATVDNTGNVVVAANIVGDEATEVAGIIKMMQVIRLYDAG
jgi:uncharacterized membrane protein YadS